MKPEPEILIIKNPIMEHIHINIKPRQSHKSFESKIFTLSKSDYIIHDLKSKELTS